MPFQVEGAFLTEVALALVSSVCEGGVEVHLFLCGSSMSADSLRCHLGRERIRPFDFDKALLGVFPLQCSPFYALETQHSVSSLLGHMRVVAASHMALTVL